MANFYGSSRSNYVRFDPEKLKILSEIFEIETYTREDGLTCVMSVTEFGETPSVNTDCLDDDQFDAFEKLGHPIPEEESEHPFGEEIDLLQVVHLAFAEDSGGLFVWMEIGAEKLRYLYGCATAIDATGEVVNQINLRDIYETPDVNTEAVY